MINYYYMNLSSGANMKVLTKLTILLSLTAYAYANIGGMAESINSTFTAIASLIGGASYLFGLCFTTAGLFKFKQHRDNPQQVQLGSCFTLLGIGILLIFMPSLVTQAGQTVFTSGLSSGGASGSSFTDLSSS